MHATADAKRARRTSRGSGGVADLLAERLSRLPVRVALLGPASASATSPLTTGGSTHAVVRKALVPSVDESRSLAQTRKVAALNVGSKLACLVDLGLEAASDATWSGGGELGEGRGEEGEEDREGEAEGDHSARGLRGDKRSGLSRQW